MSSVVLLFIKIDQWTNGPNPRYPTGILFSYSPMMEAARILDLYVHINLLFACRILCRSMIRLFVAQTE